MHASYPYFNVSIGNLVALLNRQVRNFFRGSG
jgi:hypothetical protein